MIRQLVCVLGLAAATSGFTACSSSSTATPSKADAGPKTDDEFKVEITTKLKTYIQGELNAFYDAADAIQKAAPAPTGRGWDQTQDTAALQQMKDAWAKGRNAYEHVEGAVATIFPEDDIFVDQRYDGFLSDGGPDPYLFDAEGVRGMHAIERILWADTTPPRVVAFESKLPGYVDAAFPKTEQEAADFKNKLCGQLVTDVKRMRDQFNGLALDIAFAFRGTVDLVAEQAEKVNKASNGEEESRYSQITMRDLRANYDGNLTVYKLFQDWLKSKGQSGTAVDTKIMAGMARLKAGYDAVSGDAIPEPPSTWSSTAPSEADLKSPFGMLYALVSNEADPQNDDGIVHHMDVAANVLGFPELTE